MTPCGTEKVDFSKKYFLKKKTQHHNHQKNNSTGRVTITRKKKKKLHFPQFFCCCFLCFLLACCFLYVIFLFCVCVFLDFGFLVCFFGFLVCFSLFYETQKNLCAAGLMFNPVLNRWVPQKRLNDSIPRFLQMLKPIANREPTMVLLLKNGNPWLHHVTPLGLARYQ